MTLGARSPKSHDGPPVDPDADILEVVRQGNLHDALRLLMQRHGRTVYQYCRGVVRDDARAEDIHQKVFIDAHRDLPRFAGRSLVRTWLIAIAHNRTVDDIRKQAREAREEGSLEREVSLEVADASRSPAERLDDGRLRMALLECVGELPSSIRAAVLLRYQQGRSYEEMAEICNEKAGTLQARVSRAVVALRRCIEKRTGAAA